MIPLIIDWLNDKYARGLSDHGLGFVRVLGTRYVEFRALLAMLLGFTLVILFSPRVIRKLITLKVGDNPEFYNKTLNELTRNKTNTPTMGGVLIISAILAATLLFSKLTSFYIQMGILCLFWLGAVGLADDWLKLRSIRRGAGRREGLYSWEKLVFQLALAVILGLFIHHHGEQKLKFESQAILDMSRSLNLPFLKSWMFDAANRQWVPSSSLIVLSAVPFVVLTVVVITGSSNAVNLTDGMDGLAGGIMSIVGFAFMILCLVAGDEYYAKKLLVPYIPLSAELAIVCAAMVGACLAFLWFNCNPAQVFMGDTGSLPLGGLIGYIAVVTRQEFLLLIIGGVFVMEACSVIAQVGYFKLTKNSPGGGRRLLKCAPIHHHFHLSGWTEQQVVVRFWIVSIVLVAVALATIRLR
ncbi:MAG: phospho-N-acetylmuramoyl-pentapeptide-transferase [Planctomycetes bacterium]|nr:phospho-N-acetylmuramoyl-pentapeptide-transferase [Planctomycetota bacterium]